MDIALFWFTCMIYKISKKENKKFLADFKYTF